MNSDSQSLGVESHGILQLGESSLKRCVAHAEWRLPFPSIPSRAAPCIAVIVNRHGEVEKGLEVLNELIESGRSLLRARPMNNDDYFKWSDDARTKITECFGENSPKTQKFLKGRWEIAASPDSDPSIYGTQVGANLRRELNPARPGRDGRGLRGP